MRRLLALLCLLLAGCEMQICSNGPIAAGAPQFRTVAEPVEIPRCWREANYLDAYRQGSCMWASLETVLRSQGLFAIAEQCRRECSGPATVGSCAQLAESRGLRYAICSDGDADFLDWCARTRRPAAIYWMGGRHAVTFCGYDRGDAVIVDCNAPEMARRLPKSQFLAAWRVAGGCAFTVVYWTPPRRPWT
jgi:hypothetical protein